MMDERLRMCDKFSCHLQKRMEIFSLFMGVAFSDMEVNYGRLSTQILTLVNSVLELFCAVKDPKIRGI